MDNRINILFYSRKDKLSTMVIKLLNDEEMLNFFKLYCIDDMPRKAIPSSVKQIPFMVLKDTPMPFVGDGILKWIQSARFIRQQKINSQREIVKRNMIRFQMQNNKGNLGFNNEEMGGYSDNYAYTNTDTAQAKSFMGYKDDKKHIIFTAPEAIKMNRDDMNKAIENETNTRKHQDVYKDKLYETQQKMTLLNDQMNSGQ